MRVLVLLHDAYGGHGGIARFNRDLLDALAAETAPPVEEIVVLPRRAPVMDEPVPVKISYDLRSAGGIVRYGWRCIVTLLGGGRFDLVICGHIRLLPFALLWQAPCALVLHGTEAWTPPNGLARRLAARPDAFIAVSALTRDRFVAWSGADPARFHILPNTINTARFAPGPKDAGLVARYGLEGRRVVMTLARLDPGDSYKGIDAVIETLLRLAEAAPDVSYLVAGAGDDRARLERLARDTGVADRVVFTGYVEEREKADHYRLADLFVLPGSGEGFGIVLLEALACGVPVVASKLDGSREAVRDGLLGQLVDPRDPDALLAALRRGLEAGRTDPPEGLEYFSVARFRERLSAILRDIIDRQRP